MTEFSHTGTPPPDITGLADHLFRNEASKLISVLTGRFGIERLQFAEDVVQEALVKALQTWPYYGVPKNPAAWLTQTAKNLALDVIRREKVFQDKQPQVIATLEQWPAEADVAGHAQFDNEIRDDRLRLMFVCCHPLLPPEAQVALALKTLCGFSTLEIARAFLTTEAAIAKRLVRTRQRIRDLDIPFEIPADGELAGRLDNVLQAIYLLFNEGYKASTGAHLTRGELCQEAIGLAALLADHPVGDQPRTHALLALMCLNTARLLARVDGEGNLLRLQEQDRSAWDRTLIARGMHHLQRSATGREISAYHLQAGIAACHCAAGTYADTDWDQILALYDQLVLIDDSPVVALNRAVAVAKVKGPEAGLATVNAIPNREQLNSYYLLYAVMGEFEAQLNNFPAALEYFRQALELTELKSEQTLLARRFRDCEEQRFDSASEYQDKVFD